MERGGRIPPNPSKVKLKATFVAVKTSAVQSEETREGKEVEEGKLKLSFLSKSKEQELKKGSLRLLHFYSRE